MKKMKNGELLGFYQEMERARQFESRAVDLFMTGEIPGFLHSSLGQEASAVGVCMNLGKNDYIATTHRGHSHVLAKGADMNRMMAELYGKATGYCGGKGGSMHIMDRELGILGANGIVAGGLPIAVGAGLSAVLRGTDQVTVVFFGDGASNEGATHEAMNMAAVWSLPVIFLCENNLYAESTAQACHQTVRNVADRAKAYNMNADIADGSDVLDVYSRSGKAVARARAGGGPTLLEVKTYRWLGHYVGDPGVYRPKEEVALWKEERDPLTLFREKLMTGYGIGAEVLEGISAEVGKEVERAVVFARESPPPALAGALEDIYAGNAVS